MVCPKKIPIFSIGSPGDLTYDYKVVGSNTEDIKKIIEGENEIKSILLKSKKLETCLCGIIKVWYFVTGKESLTTKNNSLE